jgi:hypothetical protein
MTVPPRSSHSVPLPFLAVMLSALAGCGGGPPAAAPATETAPPAAAAPAPSAASPSEAPAAAEPAPAPPASAGPAPSAAPAEAAPQSVRSLGDVITAPTIAYMLSDGESGLRAAAEKVCTAKSGEDLAARASCMEKEREKFTADVLVFGKENKVLYLTVYRRVRSNLTELAKCRIELVKDADRSVGIHILSEKGGRPIFAGKKDFVVTAPSESTIQLDDPQHGKLVYEARIGLVDKPAE